MHCQEPCTLQILGRQYRFKHPSEKLQQLTVLATELEQRLERQASVLPLASRDQLLILTAINLLDELAEQQRSAEQQLKTLIAKLNEAG